MSPVGRTCALSVGAMTGSLNEASRRARRPKLVSNLMLATGRQFDANVQLMRKVAEDVIAERRAHPGGQSKDDPLGRMLNGVDPETGERLSDENIAYQMITFLIAGHETTSGLLSFATYLLLRNPHRVLKTVNPFRL